MQEQQRKQVIQSIGNNASISAYLSTTVMKNERFEFRFSIPNHKESANANMVSFLYTI